jgi:hypothetical protein
MINYAKQTQFPKTPKMNLNHSTANDYERKSPLGTSEKQSQNKPNQTQFYPSLRLEGLSASGEVYPPMAGRIQKGAGSQYNYFNLFFIFIGLSPASWYNACQLGLFSRLSGIFS